LLKNSETVNNIIYPSRKSLSNESMRHPVLILLIMFSCLSGQSFAETDGTALAQKVYNRPDGKDAVSKSTMVLKSKGHKPRYRTLYIYRMDTDDGETRSLIRFSEPADITDTGMLTLDSPGQESSQWVYLPALDRARRIASSRKGGHFVGSDLYYEDLQKRDVDKDHHRILGKGKVGKIVTTNLESIPVDPDNSVYSKRISWIHTKTLIPLKVEYFKANSEQAIKRLKVTKIKKIQGYWTVLDSTMTDLKSGKQTRMTTKTIQYDQKLPDSLFSRQALSDTQLEESYRP
jgi:outer membrane lipoprotein-sorting protein